MVAGRRTQPRVAPCDGTTIDFEGKGQHPIVCVDFEQAETYCSHRDKRLPFDEEWEWAARGGDRALEFPWGNQPPGFQLCWSGTRERKQTCRVGGFPEGDNRWGVKDLAGNVIEWTRTRDDAHMTERAARGGSWRDSARALVRVARPGWFKPDHRAASLGIRCAADASNRSGLP
jgi:formylglycine-generating enzyme required for sulfatase activity